MRHGPAAHWASSYRTELSRTSAVTASQARWVRAAGTRGRTVSCEHRAVIPEEQILRSPPTQLAVLLLGELPDRPFRRSGVIGSLLDDVQKQRGIGPSGVVVVRTSAPWTDHPRESLLLATAFGQLERDGLIVQWPPSDPQSTDNTSADVFSLTAFGRRMKAEPRASETLVARRRLSVESLHPELAKRIRDDVDSGAFETAVLKALRAVEAEVRDLTGHPRSERGDRLTGTALMQYAFSPTAPGPLTDLAAEPGEQAGTMNLFAGAFGAVRNAVAHTEIEWADPIEAAEYVLLADLLMRILSRTRTRLAEMHPASPHGAP